MAQLTSQNGAAPSTDKAARRKRFEDVFPIIADDLLAYVKGEKMPKEAVEWYEKASTSSLYIPRLPWLDAPHPTSS